MFLTLDEFRLTSDVSCIWRLGFGSLKRRLLWCDASDALVAVSHRKLVRKVRSFFSVASMQIQLEHSSLGRWQQASEAFVCSESGKKTVRYDKA